MNKKKKVHPKLNLNKDLWLQNTEQVRRYRENLQKKLKNKCELSGEELVRPSVDHNHDTGEVRGVISSHWNVIEGKYKKIFKKYAGKWTELSFEEFIVKLGDYLSNDCTNRPLHFKTLQDKRTEMMKLRKDTLVKLLLDDYGIDKSESYDTILKQDLVTLYLKEYIRELEEDLFYRRLKSE